MENGETISLTIEEYVKRTRESLTNTLSVKHIFEDFVIKVTGWRKKDINSNYVIRELEERLRLTIVKEDEEKIYYEDTITRVEDLEKMPFSCDENTHSLVAAFIEK